MKIVALAGGVGGAKLADGLQRIVGEALTVIVNTGDDFELHGLHISPDLDTVMYTLAGLANVKTGWGLADDTFNALDMLSHYGAEDWFRLGDRDLATHILRTQLLRDGMSLTQVTERLSRALGVRAALLPMTDDPFRTVVNTNAGVLPFQEYFVRRAWQPVIYNIRFQGVEQARPTPEVMAFIERAEAIILCPSNPFVSIDPILALPGVRDRIIQSKAVKLAVSPIIGGEALKGPAAKMFRELGSEPSALNVARHYAGLLHRFVLDTTDEAQARTIKDLGLRVWVTDTVMRDTASRVRLAQEIIDWISK